MRAFRYLKEDEIECRVSQVKLEGITLLLYKTARTDADILDETVGADKWENDFKVIDEVLYGGIGVDYGNGMVWKWDAGTESNMEADKGRASDAFKRAGFKHGIGRELYTAPYIFVPADKCNITKDRKCYDKFTVSWIDYTDGRITGLAIVNTKTGREVYTMSKGAVLKADERPYPLIPCDNCGKEIKPARNSKGEIVSVLKIAEETNKRFGKTLCAECAKQEKANE